MKRLKQKDLYRFIPKFLIPHSSFLIARQREKWQFVGLGRKNTHRETDGYFAFCLAGYYNGAVFLNGDGHAVFHIA